MSLPPGPRICSHCRVFAFWHEMGDGPGGEWECPICGTTDITEHADFNESWDKYKENEKFLKFVKGIE